MRSSSSWLLAALVAASHPGCTRPNPAYCTEHSDCDTGYCDGFHNCVNPPDADDECSRSGGLIAFTSDRDGDDEIFYAFGDGSSPRQLTRNTWPDTRPRWARDGRQVSFLSWPSGSPELHLANTSSSELGEITGDDSVDQVWFPDSLQLLFWSNRDGNYEVYTVHADGTGLTNLSMDPAQDAYAGLSPDGSRIVFQTTRDGNYEVAVMGADGANPELLTQTQSPIVNGTPKWSPDGSTIGFIRSTQLWTMTSNGVAEQELPGAIGNINLFEWSPDGSKIAYVSTFDSYDVWTMNADGSQRINVSNHDAHDDEPRWSPDGTRLLFESNRDGNDELYTVRPDGSSLTNVTSSPTRERQGDWVGCP